jgi:hypothetical protein
MPERQRHVFIHLFYFMGRKLQSKPENFVDDQGGPAHRNAGIINILALFTVDNLVGRSQEYAFVSLTGVTTL